MKRKVAAGAAGALIAGLMAAAPVAAIGDYIPSEPNPELAPKCGLDFGLVLDSSGSIGDTGIANLKTATNAFVDALVDTGSRVAVTSFSTSSPGSGGSNLAPIELTGANLATVKGSYSGLASDGWTNWEDGLQKMADYTFSPDLLVFITDGNPNTKNPPGAGNNASPDGSPAAVNPAITLANAFKGDGTKMFGIAVGGSINLEPIKAVTNTTTYDGTNFATAGYVQTADYATLALRLKEIAVDLCAPSLTVTKLADTPATNGFEPADGWTFDTTVTIPTAAGTWVIPGSDPIAQNTASTKSLATSGGGAATFQWEPNGDAATDPVVLQETLKNGYERHGKLTCTAKNVLAGTERSFEVVVGNNGTWNLGQVKAREIVSCTAKNTLTRLKLTKVVDGGSATPADFTLTATGPQGSKPYSHAGNHNAYEPISGDVQYTLGESGPANYSAGAWSCDGVPVKNGNLITVAKGTQTECTLTNTRDVAELKLVKQVDGGAATADAWTLTAKAAAPLDDKNISTPGGSGQFETVYAGTEYTLGETGPGNYTGSTWKCTTEQPEDRVIAQLLQQGDSVQLAKDERVTCVIVNTRDRGSLTITKEFNALASGYTGTFDVAYTCVEGGTPVKSGTASLAAGQSATVEGLPTGTVCTVTEPSLPAAPAGWAFNPPSFAPANGQVTITAKDQAATVRVVNSITQVNPEVVRRPCPINPKLVTPKPKRVGNTVLVKRVRTNDACVIVKPVVLCRPLGTSAAGEATFCDTRSTRSGRVRVKSKGYEAVRVTVVVRARPIPSEADRWKGKTWRKSWVLR